MTRPPHTLLADLRARGICFEAAEDRLRFFPAEAVTESERGEIRQHKLAFLTLLHAEVAELAAAAARLRVMSNDELAASIGDFGALAVVQDDRLEVQGEPKEPLRPIDWRLWEQVLAEVLRRQEASDQVEAHSRRVS